MDVLICQNAQRALYNFCKMFGPTLFVFVNIFYCSNPQTITRLTTTELKVNNSFYFLSVRGHNCIALFVFWVVAYHYVCLLFFCSSLVCNVHASLACMLSPSRVFWNPQNKWGGNFEIISFSCHNHFTIFFLIFCCCCWFFWFLDH